MDSFERYMSAYSFALVLIRHDRDHQPQVPPGPAGSEALRTAGMTTSALSSRLEETLHPPGPRFVNGEHSTKVQEPGPLSDDRRRAGREFTRDRLCPAPYRGL